jgi:hypothetical protein
VETGRRLRVLRTDNGGEFTSVEFEMYYAEHGIERQHTAPYTPQQNGVVERRNQSVVTMARSLLKSQSMPAMLWGEAVATAVYLLNRAPTKAVDGITPYVAWHGCRPDVHHLCTFRWVAYIKATKSRLKKLEDRGTPAVFIGYERGAKAWSFYDPVSRHTVVSRDAVFDEPASWNWEQEDTGPGEDLVVEYHTMQLGSELPGAPVPMEDMPAPSPAAPTPLPATPAPAATPPPRPEFVSPPPDAEDYLDADADDVKPRYHTIDNILGAGSPPGLATRQVAAALHLQIEDEPATFAEAEQHQPWRHAMLEEIESIVNNKTWRLADLPRGQRPIGLKWVYKLKKDAAGEVIKHKARLVAKGYVQQQGVDFDEVFAPVARIESVRLLLALAAQEGWLVHHMDVKSAFLNRELVEEVYVRQPPGFIIVSTRHSTGSVRHRARGTPSSTRRWWLLGSATGRRSMRCTPVVRGHLDYWWASTSTISSSPETTTSRLQASSSR